MQITSITIEGFRSLEGVTLKNLSNTNVLIGRNNSGKSSVLNWFRTAKNAIFTNSINWKQINTGQRDLVDRLPFQLTFELTENEVETIIGKYLNDTESFQRFMGFGLFLKVKVTGLLRADGMFFATLSTCNKQELWIDLVGKQSDNISYRIDMLDNFQQGWLNDPDMGIQRSRTRGGVPLFDLSKNSLPGAIYTEISEMIVRYFSNMFLFDPFRHGELRLQVNDSLILASNGSNLVQVLHALKNNQEHVFQEIERFMQNALPGIGNLFTRLQGSTTHSAFRSEFNNFDTQIDEMGSGIEQLLMVATALYATSNDHIICLEEPESHLHPGAQRYLLEKLIQSNRQVFITTHSPVFVNNTHPNHRVYRVTQTEGRGLGTLSWT
jgi:putative ATP-dependent endonuclease of the OLD family